ncbi:MAG: SGNH/GDSL hydrolase family protein [Erythrobacter sp.]
MLVRAALVATLLILAGLALIWPERVRWTEGGSAVVAHRQLPPSGSFPLTLPRDATIVIEGDSLVGNRRGVNEGVPWPTRLEKLLEGVEVVNRGSGESTAERGLVRWQEAKCGDLAILLYGANDAGIRGWIRGRSGIGIERYTSALEKIIARHKDCGAMVLVLAPLAPGSSAMEARLSPYRDAAREVALQEGVHFLDPLEAWTDVAAPLQMDGLHLSDAGREALASFVGRSLALAE